MRYFKFVLRLLIFFTISPWLVCSAVNAEPEHHNPVCVHQAFCVESLVFADFISHYQTAGGEGVVFPELAVIGKAQLGSPFWHLEIRHFRGTSKTLPDGFQASVGDLEARIERRLDDPLDGDRKDSVSRNISVWVSWKIWTSTNLFATTSTYERDEGLGFGVSRFPSNKGLSYWYEASLYPSVRTNLADQKNAYTASLGGMYNLLDSLGLGFGYRIQTLRTGTRKTDRAEEQGVLFGLRGTF